MTGFFYSWRRKIGGLLLLMSLALMGLWIRSRQIDDVVRFDLFGRKHFIQSCQGRAGWWAWNDPDAETSLPHLMSEVLPKPSTQDLMPDEIGWGLRQDAKHADLWFAKSFHDDLQGDMRDWIVPYWTLVWPSTLLSALLLFWMPRRETRNMTTNSESPTLKPAIFENQNQSVETAQP